MVRIQRCGCLTSYNQYQNQYVKDQAEVVGLVFLIEKLQKRRKSCRKTMNERCCCRTVINVAIIDNNISIVATYLMSLRYNASLLN